MAQRFNSTSVTVTANGTLSPLTATTDTIVSSVALQGASGGTHTIQVQKSGGSPADVYKPSNNGEVLPAPFALQTGDALKIVTAGYSSDSTFLISYAYESESFAGESIGVHNDVNLTGLADGDVLVYNAASGDFEPGAGGGGGGASSLDDLSDVTVTTPSTGDFLIESGTGFVNRTAYATDLEMSSGDSTSVSTKILTNTSNIATNASDIANAGTLISANSAAISANTANISSNDADIVNLTNQLNTANANIASNDSDIATLNTDISDAGTLINNNAAAIAANTANISNNDTDILNLQNSVNTNTGYISDINNGVGNVIAVKVDGQADITGTVTLSQGPNVTLTQSGNDIEIASTGSGVTINNNTNNNILTASGTANTIEGEPLFTYNAATGTVGLYASATNGIQLDAGAIPTANPTIGSSGFFTQLEFSSDVVTSNDVILRDQAKIAFDTDPTNTYIAANAATPEDLEIHADQDLHLLPDGNVGIGTITPTNKLHVVGNTFTSANFIGDGVVVGSINYSKQITIQTPSSTFPAQGELSPIAGTGLTAGQLYYLNGSGVWTLADATAEASCKNMLGIAVDTVNVMIRGHLSYSAFAGFTDGEPLYVKPSSTGDITNLVPSVSGHIVRKVGFCLDGSVRSIYFNPSNDYFEVE